MPEVSSRPALPEKELCGGAKDHGSKLLRRNQMGARSDYQSFWSLDLLSAA